MKTKEKKNNSLISLSGFDLYLIAALKGEHGRRDDPFPLLEKIRIKP